MDIRGNRSVASLAVLAVVGFLPIYANAQGLTGTLVGTVRDSQGGVLPSALVRLTSPSLMNGEERTTSNDKGQWRFPVLPPGEYVLTVELTPGFAPYHKDGLRIGAGQTVDYALELQLAGMTQAVSVEADSSINSRTSGLETRFGSDYIRTTPMRRYSMYDLIRSLVAP